VAKGAGEELVPLGVGVVEVELGDEATAAQEQFVQGEHDEIQDEEGEDAVVLGLLFGGDLVRLCFG
jgi:hypothetical protein